MRPPFVRSNIQGMQFQGVRLCRAALIVRWHLPFVMLALLLNLVGCGHKAPVAQKVVDLYISSNGDLIEFLPDTLTCPAGALVHLTFHHAGRFVSARHNWVLTYPDKLEALTKDYLDNNGMLAKEDPRVIAATPMCDKGETVMVTFTAPPPGDYPFLCSTHPEDMRGVLHVTK